MSGAGRLFRSFRLRHGLDRARLAAHIAVPARRLAAWEAGTLTPEPADVLRLVDLTQKLPAELLAGLTSSVVHCGLPRALTRSSRLNLRAVSGPAIDKRPTIVKWIGSDLLPLACAELQQILDDRDLQRALARREVAAVVSTSRSVLRTEEADRIGLWRTTTSYFFHDGVRYGDAYAVPALPGERTGYTAIYVDELGADLFGDQDALDAALAASAPPRRATAP